MGSRSRSPSRVGAGVLLALLGVVAGFLGGFMGGLFRRRTPGRYVSDRHAPTAD